MTSVWLVYGHYSVPNNQIGILLSSGAQYNQNVVFTEATD